MIIPNPGSIEAFNLGCICPTLDNEYGRGIGGNGKKFGFVISEDCPLHNKDKENIFIYQFKKTIKENKHTQEQVAKHLGISSSSLSRILQYKQQDLAEKLSSKIRKYTRYGFKNDKTETEKVKSNNILRKFIKKEVKNNHYQNVGCLIATTHDSLNGIELAVPVVSIGLSMCNIKHDEFSKEIAEEIAIGRANNFNKKYNYKNTLLYYDSKILCPVYLNDEVNRFIHRCVSYYKDKFVIVPRFIFINYK